MMYCSLISHIPLVLAYSVSFILNYSNLVAVGLFIEMALLRVYAVVHVSISISHMNSYKNQGIYKNNSRVAKYSRSATFFLLPKFDL